MGAAAELLGDGLVAIVRNQQEPTTNRVLLKRGVLAIVYVDGHDMGVVRAESMTQRMDDPVLVDVIRAGAKSWETATREPGSLIPAAS